MTAPRFDITLDGNSYRLVRGADQVAYRRRWERREAFNQSVPNQEGALNSRGDRAIMYQTDWSDGSAWWLPLVGPDTARMYFDANNMDTFSKPGTILPANKGTDPATALLDKSPMFSTVGGLYGVGSTKTTDTTYYDIYKFTGADWVRQTGYTSGVSNATIHGIAYDTTSAYAYVLAADYIARFKTSGTQNSNWQAITAKAGDAIFVTNTGLIFVYNAGLIKQLVTTGPSLSTIVDDGYGLDLLANIASPATSHLHATDIKLATAHSSGVYYAKNTMADGLPVCYLSRVDRDQAGSYIRYPLTTLPAGLVCLNLTVHLGSIVMACTKDWQMVLANDRSKAEYPVIDYYAFTPGGGLTPLGSANKTRPTELPVRFLGTDGDNLFIGSNKRVWVYSGASGGLHPWVNPADETSGLYDGVAPAMLTAGTQVLMLKRGTGTTYYATNAENPTTVATFGTDLATYLLTSNYFDFGNPFENKTLMTVDLSVETASASQRFTVQIEVDGGTWTTIATHSNATWSSTDLSAGAYTGRRFRYRIAYETKTAALVGVNAIQFSAAQGIMVPVFDLVLDGSQIRGVENTVVDPETAYDNLEASAAKATPITLIDYFRSERVEDSSTYTVTIAMLEISKHDPNEATFRVQLVGSP